HIVRVHMDGRNFESLGEVAGIEGRPRVAGTGRESDLVVRDDVDRAADSVAGELGKIERLRDYSLAGEGGIAVDRDGQRSSEVPFRPSRLPAILLGRPRTPHDNRVHEFEVAGIRAERDRYILHALG